MQSVPFASRADEAYADKFFLGRREARDTWNEVCDLIAKHGAVEQVATKSRVSLLAETRFLWVHEAHLDGSITIGFLLPHPVDEPRFRKGQVGTRWSHHTRVESKLELKGELGPHLIAAYGWDAGH